MKRKDISLIVVVAIVSAVISLLVTNMLFGSNKRNLTAETVEPISSEFKTPDKTVFNEQAINPTQLIQIGENDNPSPF